MVRCRFMTNSMLHFLSTVYRLAYPCAWYGVDLFRLHCVDDVLRVFLNWALFCSSSTSLLTLVTQVWRVSLCSLSRLLATAHKLSVNILSALDNLFSSLLDPVLSADWTEHGSATMYVVKDSGACLLVVHVCRTVDRVVGHPRPSLAGISVPWASLPGPTDVP